MMDHPDNIYLSLTRRFNRDRLRTIISSGQAVVLHRLAIMSKDGDWIVRETPADFDHVLDVLEEFGAVYRFGAPFDVRWHAHGWSSHFEFSFEGLRVRCDFFSRPPRISEAELRQLWQCQSGCDLPFLDVEPLLKVKQTQREKDYAVIGELARRLPPEGQLVCGRSARDLIELAAKNHEVARLLAAKRPLLCHALVADRDALEEALDKERRILMRADEDRMDAFAAASSSWRAVWPSLQTSLRNLSLRASHTHILQEADGVLPFAP